MSSSSPSGDRIRVLVASSGLGHVARGFERASEDIAKALQGHADVILARGGGPLMSQRSVRLPCVQRFGTLARAFHWPEQQAYRWEQHSFAVGLHALALVSRAHVIHVHEPGTMNILWHLRRVVGGAYRIVFANGARLSPEHLVRPDMVHCLTPIHANSLLTSGFAPNRVRMLPYGIDLSPAPPTSADSSALRVLGVGALNASNKGVDIAIHAAQALPNVVLTFLGQHGPETQHMLDLAQREIPGRHHLATVSHDEVLAHLRRADVFVLPSNHEALPVAVMEAMGAGLPCVVSDIPEHRWLVGDAGILVARNDVAAWTAALQGLTANRRAELGTKAITRARDFQWSALVPAYLEMYRDAMALPAR